MLVGVRMHKTGYVRVRLRTIFLWFRRHIALRLETNIKNQSDSKENELILFN